MAIKIVSIATWLARPCLNAIKQMGKKAGSNKSGRKFSFYNYRHYMKEDCIHKNQCREGGCEYW